MATEGPPDSDGSEQIQPAYEGGFSMQTTSSTASRRILTIVRRPVRRAYVPHHSHVAPHAMETRVHKASGDTDFRGQIAEAFIALGNGVAAAAAQAHANAFYRSSRQHWARALDGIVAHDFRSQMGAAFRALGAAVGDGAASERTLGFYRGSGQAWAESLG
jgi:hypothetical protein